MEREQLENLYLVNGLGDFKLRNLGDLMKIHGINARTTEGFSKLSKVDKKAYETFIIRYINAHGLGYRSTIYPEKIYRAFEINYKVKEDPADDYYLNFSGEVWDCTDKNNDFKVKSWGDIKDKNKPGVISEKSESYLRIELKERETDSWLHITCGGEQWY